MASAIRLGIVGLVLVALWSWVGPSQLGGPLTFAVTSGISMEPDLSAGDLVLVRRTANIERGQVILYRGDHAGHDVLHRVIAITDGAYTTKGDNNAWVDQDRPTAAQVRGVYWGHIPGAGKWLSVLQSPVGGAAIGGLLLGVLAMSMTPSASTPAAAPSSGPRARYRGPQGRTPSLRTRAAAFAESAMADAAMGTALALIAVGVLLAAWMLMQPARTTITVATSYAHSADWEYQGRTGWEGVLPDYGSAPNPLTQQPTTGQPIFPSVTPLLDATMNYRMTGALQDVSGQARLFVILREDVTGWSQEFELEPWTSFTGNTVSLTSEVDLREAIQALSQFEQSAQINGALYRAVLAAEVRVAGTDDRGAQVTDEYRPFLVFRTELPRLVRVDHGGTVSPEAMAAGIDPLGDLVRDVTPRELVSHAEVDRKVSVLAWDVPVWGLRVVAVALAVVGLAGAFTLHRLRRWADERGEWFRIRARFGSHLAFSPQPPRDPAGREYLDLRSFEDILAMAATHMQPILCVEESQRVTFFVLDLPNAIYRFQLPIPAHGPGHHVATQTA